MTEWANHLQTAIGIFAIVDPMGAVPVFISLTSDTSLESRSRIARIAALAVALIMGGTVWVGEPVLHFFGISVAAFRVAGG